MLICLVCHSVEYIASNCIHEHFTIIIIVIGGQRCTDYVDIQQNGNRQTGRDRLVIIPRLNFTCNSRITSIRARVILNNSTNGYTSFHMWRPSSVDSTIYNRIGGVQLQSDEQVTTGSNGFLEANIILTGNDTIEIQSGDVVGYYHPPDVRYQVRDIFTDGYILYRFIGSSVPNSVDLNNRNGTVPNPRQPLIQFTIGTETIYVLVIV